MTEREVQASLTREQLVKKLKATIDVMNIINAIESPPLQVALGLPLMAWRNVGAVSGAVAFGRYDVNGEQTDLIIAVNAPKSRRAEFEPADLPDFVTFCMVG